MRRDRGIKLQMDLLMIAYLQTGMAFSPRTIFLCEEASMPREKPCPFRDQPANEGGHRDARIGENAAPVFQFRYTPEEGTGDPHARCAFLALTRQALAQQEIDRTQVCRRCARVIRVHSVH